MRKILCSLFLASVFLLNSRSQNISDVQASIESNTVVVKYSLQSKHPVTITLFWSTDGGATWKGPEKSVSGDAGSNISEGAKKIIWDVLKDFEFLIEDNLVFKVEGTSSYGTFTDLRDNKQYGTIVIDGREWLTENMDFEVKGGSWYYNDDPANGEIYGRLYNWQSAKKACPEGWHLPALLEWKSLADYLGGLEIAGGKMKSLSDWNPPNNAASNESKLGMQPGGQRKSNGYSADLKNAGYYWSFNIADQIDLRTAFSILLEYNSREVQIKDNFVETGLSVRCIKNKISFQ